MPLDEFWRNAQEKLGQDLKYIRQNWSWDHLTFQLDGLLKKGKREREEYDRQKRLNQGELE